MHTLLHHFQDRIGYLTHAEKHIFYYLNNNLSDAKNLSMVRLAELNNVSTTTIVRMCDHLGLSGYSDLKYIMNHLVVTNIPFVEDYAEQVKNDVDHALTNININKIESLTQSMHEASIIYVVAVGLSKPIAEYFAKLLIQANMNCIYVYESHMIDLLQCHYRKDQFIIFVSNSGETATLIQASEKLSYLNANTAAIINSESSTLAQNVSLALTNSCSKSTLNGYDITSRSALVAILDTIFSHYIHNYLKS